MYYFDGIFLFLFSGGSGSSSSVEQEIEHKCEMCGTEFVTATSLKIHRLKCEKQKKMACEFCLDEFRSETSLKMHKLICVKMKKSDDKKDNFLDKNNDNNDESSTNTGISSGFTRRPHDPIRDFFEKEERLKKEKDQQQQIKIRETNIVVDMEKTRETNIEKPNNTINNIIEVLHQKQNKELELKQQQTKIRETNNQKEEELLVPVVCDKINKFADQDHHVKELPVKIAIPSRKCSIDENPKVISKESFKIHQTILQKEFSKIKDQDDEPKIVQKVNIKERIATESGSTSSNFKNVPPKVDVEQTEQHWPKVQKLKIKLPKKPDIAQPIIRNSSDNVDPSTTR